MREQRKNNRNLEYLGREEPIDAEWTAVESDSGRGHDAESAWSEFKAWAHDTAKATARIAKNATLVGSGVLVLLLAIGTLDSGENATHEAGRSEPSDGMTKVAENAAEEAPSSNRTTPPVAKGSRWPRLQAHPGMYYTYTLTDGRPAPLTVIVAGAASAAPDYPNIRSTALSQVGSVGLGGAVQTDTMIFNCDEQTTTIMQTVTDSELLGANTKVYSADSLERKKLDAITAPAFNMVCNNSWERLAEMIVPQDGIDGFVQARLRATH